MRRSGSGRYNLVAPSTAEAKGAGLMMMAATASPSGDEQTGLVGTGASTPVDGGKWQGGDAGYLRASEATAPSTAAAAGSAGTARSLTIEIEGSRPEDDARAAEAFLIQTSPSKVPSLRPAAARGVCGLRFIETWTQFAVFVAYVTLYLMYGAWIHGTRGIVYSASMLMTAVLSTKIIVSAVAFLIFDGTPSDLVRVFVAHRRELLLYAVPALAYATTDTLSVYCLKHLDPPTVALLYNIRVVFLLILFQYFLKTRLNRFHWASMGLIVGGCVVKELPMVLAANGVGGGSGLAKLLKDRGADVAGAGAAAAGAAGAGAAGAAATAVAAASGVAGSAAATAAAAAASGVAGGAAASGAAVTTYALTILMLVVMAQLASFAAVYNEKLLKEQRLSLNVQNMAMYSWALLTTLFYTMLFPVRPSQQRFWADAFSLRMWWQIYTWPLCVSVVLNAAYGLVTSYFIKSLNNVVREVACGFHIIGSIPISMACFGHGLHPADVAAVALVLAGVAVYNRHPVRAPPALPSSTDALPPGAEPERAEDADAAGGGGGDGGAAADAASGEAGGGDGSPDGLQLRLQEELQHLRDQEALAGEEPPDLDLLHARAPAQPQAHPELLA